MPKPAGRRRLPRRRTFSAAGLSAVRRVCPRRVPCAMSVGNRAWAEPKTAFLFGICHRNSFCTHSCKADEPLLNGATRFCETACRPSPLGCRPALPAGRSFSSAAHRFAEFARFPTLAEILQLCSRCRLTALYKQPASTTGGTLVLPPNSRFQKQKQLVFFRSFWGFSGDFLQKVP